MPIYLYCYLHLVIPFIEFATWRKNLAISIIYDEVSVNVNVIAVSRKTGQLPFVMVDCWTVIIVGARKYD